MKTIKTIKTTNNLNLALLLAMLVFGLGARAQVNTYGNSVNKVQGENTFIDGTEFSDGFDNEKGKGIAFPTTDLTQWEFAVASMDGLNFPTFFDGLLVYNTATGQTKTGHGIQVEVSPGFYYFSNPDGSASDRVNKGRWMSVKDTFAGTGAPTTTNQPNPKGGDIYIDESTGDVYTYNSTTNAWVKQEGTDSQDLSVSFDTSTNKLTIGLTGDPDGSNNAEIDLTSIQDGDAWNVTGEDRTSNIGRTGNVGIGINSPSEKLDVNGTSLFRNGKQATVYTGDQIQFGYNGTNQYKNAIRSRHHGGEDTYNAIDFYTWDAGVDGKSDSPTLHGMTVAGGRVGVGVTVPTKELDVDGELKVRTLAAGGAAGDQVVVADADGVLKKVAASSTFLGSDDQKLSVGAGAADTAVIALENGDDVTLKAASNIAISETGSTINVEVDEADLADIPATALTPGNNNEVLTTNAAGTIEWQAQSAINDGDAWGVTGEDKTTNVGRTGSVGIGTDTPISTLTVNSNLAHDGNFNYSTAAVSIFDNNHNGGNTPNGTRDILHLAREGVGGGAYGNKASFALGRFENSSSSSRSQLDIKLTDASFNQHNTVMSLRSNGNVGVGTAAPTQKLDVDGSARIRTLAAGGATGDQVVVADADGVLKKIDPASTFIGSDDQKVTTFAVSGENLELEVESDSGGKQTVALDDIVREPWRTGSDDPANDSSTDVYYDNGSVSVGTATTRQAFITTGAVIGRVRTHTTTDPIAWEDNDYIIIVKNDGIDDADKGPFLLPDPGNTATANNTNNIPIGRMVCIRNNTGSKLFWSAGDHGNGGGPAPIDHSVIQPQVGEIFVFDGEDWHPIASGR